MLNLCQICSYYFKTRGQHAIIVITPKKIVNISEISIINEDHFSEKG